MIQKLIKSVSALFIIAGALFSSMPAHAAGGGLNISATSLVLAPTHMAGTIRVTSERNYPDVVQVKVYKWDGGGPTENLQPSDDILGVPTVFTLPPNGSQIVRVALRGPSASTDEQAYRVQVSEVQSQYMPSANIGMLLNLNFPVFVAPTGQLVRQATWSQQRQGSNLLLTVKNTGNMHLRVRGFTLVDAGGTLVGQNKYDTTVLPGQTHVWTVKALHQFSGTLHVHADSDNGSIDDTVN